MSVRPFAVAALLGVLGVSTARAQGNPECASYAAVPRAFNTCNAAIDGTRAFHPIAGLLISGGNPVIGDFGTVGGIGHASLTLRATAAKLNLPSRSYNGTSATVPRGDSLTAPIPSVDLALGLIKGGKMGVFGVDLLGSATLLPTTQIDNLTVGTGARKIGSIAVGLGYGARISLSDDNKYLPGLSFSVMRRELPRLVYGSLTGGDDFEYDVLIKSTSARVEVGKTLSLLTLGAGAGYDWYRGDANIRFRNPVTTLPASPIAIDLNNKREIIYGNAALNLGPVKLVGELGYQLGKDQNLTTTFQGFDTKAGKVFFGGGLRFAF